MKRFQIPIQRLNHCKYNNASFFMSTQSHLIGNNIIFTSNTEFVTHRLNCFIKIQQRVNQIYQQCRKQEMVVTLPDGKEVKGKAFQITPYQIAKGISKNLAENSIAAKVKYFNRVKSPFSEQMVSVEVVDEEKKSDNYELVDLNRPLEGDCLLQLISFEEKAGREVFWHSSSHLLGQSLEQNFGAFLCHGPSIESGFFYDSFTGDHKISQNDYQKIEKSVRKYVQNKEPFERIILSKEEALQMFSYNPFKTQLIKTKIPDSGLTSAYRCGNLIDLCAGPHIPSAAMVKGFKILKNSSAYWLGKKQNDDLQRVYGISFPKQSRIDEYLKRQEELAKRDHRNIGAKQDLFHFTPYSPGSPLFFPHGTIILNRLQDLMRSEYKIRGYHEVLSPNIYSSELWKVSGHYFKYKENIFWIKNEQEEFGLKPMNCPGHCIMFGLTQRSYKDLPYRMADFSILHRNQLHGALSGLTRVRKFQQDDAHIFCRPDQIEDQIMQVLDLLDYIYSVFKFQYSLELSTRPEHFLGKLEDWHKSEAQLKQALQRFGKPYKINQGDGAFYGPKIDVKLLDAFEREHQCGTIQLDFQLPQRFNLQYRASHVEKGEIQKEEPVESKEENHLSPENESASEEEKYNQIHPLKKGFERPVIIHRAIFGSLQRFIAILCEETAGKWDFWLSPKQLKIIPIGKDQVDLAKKMEDKLVLEGFSVSVDNSDDRLDKKIRNAQLESYNYIGVIGNREVEQKSITLRRRDEKEPFGTFSMKDLLNLLNEQKKPMISRRRKEMQNNCDSL